MFKKILKFIIILLPWFLSSLICNDYSLYNKINLPKFAIPTFLFGIVWPILYILISISIYKIFDNSFLNLKEYKKVLLSNYIFNQLYTIIFFCFKSTFFSFIDVLLTFITSLFLYYETKELDKKASKFLIPYTLFLIYALILSVTVYFINL